MLKRIEKFGVILGKGRRLSQGRSRYQREKGENEKQSVEFLDFIQMNSNTAAVTKRLSKEAGKIIFQPRRIN